MRLFATLFPRLTPIRAALLAAAALALFIGSAQAVQPTKRVVKETENAALGQTILTTNKGKTLYSLSAETHGRFICTGACLASWRPLLVSPGVKPKGPVKLGTRKRPDGRVQVTYKGLPLYSFNGDVKQGETHGEGIKDVGTWHVAKPPRVSTAPVPEPEPSPSPYPY